MQAQRVERPQYPPGYDCARWTLVILLALHILCYIAAGAVITVFTDKFIDVAVEQAGVHADQAGVSLGRNILLGITWTIVAFTILIDFLGFFGAIKNHYCMALSYCIINTVLGLLSIFIVVRIGSFQWGIFIYNWIVIGLAFYVSIQIRKVQTGTTVVYA